MIESLNKSNLELALEKGLTIVPDIEKILGFRFVDGSIMEAMVIENATTTPQKSIPEYNSVKKTISRIYKQTYNYNWYTKNDIPFETENTDGNSRQLLIDDPLADNVLAQKIETADDNLLLFVYFRPQGAYFGQYKSDVTNDSQYKHIIALSYSNALKAVLDAFWEAKAGMQKISDSIKHYYEAQKNKQNISTVNIVELSYFYLHQISSTSGREVNLSPGAEHKLSTYEGSLVDLKDILEAAYNASQIVQGLFDSSEALLIDEAFLNFKAIEKSTPIQKEASDKNSNVRSFLNRLEDAGKMAKSKDLRITGKHLGENVSPKSISAAAISEYLSKHKKSIREELNTQPHKWQIIRKEFNPIMKIVTS